MKRFFCVILFLSIFLLPIWALAQNIALNKSYTLSPPNNYGGAPKNDLTSLTDGVHTIPTYFYTRKTTLGWLKVPQITITIDLGSSSNIDSVSFNTCRRIDRTINYPSHIYVFLSNNNKSFIYAGDAAAVSDNVPGPYQIKKFFLDKIKSEARYVKLCIIPNGLLTFCDEIQVTKGDNRMISSNNLSVINNVDYAVDSLLSNNFTHKNLLGVVQSRLQLSNGVNDSRLDTALNILSTNNLVSGNVEKAASLLKETISKNLHKFNTPFVLEKTSPWAMNSPYYVPDSDKTSLDYKFVLPDNGHQYGAFMVTNATLKKEVYTLSTSRLDTSVLDFVLYNTFFVPAKDFKLIPDALIPIKNSGISLDPGMSAMIFFEMTGKKAGQVDPIITIQSNQLKKNIQINTQVIHLNKFDNFRLNGNIWAYPNLPVLKAVKADVINDLEKHHINTVVVPIGYVPALNKRDFSTLTQYISMFPFAQKIIIGTNFYSSHSKAPDPGAPFMSSAWKNNFEEWYKILLKSIQKMGIPASKVFYYPYDEIRGKDVADYINFATWVTKALPQVHLYATINPKVSGFDTLVNFFAIAQLGMDDSINIPNLPSRHGEIWTYDNSGHSRSEPPYRHYRLMAWDAYLHDVTGIGFWSYTGGNFIGKVTDPFRDVNLDFGVIYIGAAGKTIISTRRWEAFSLGFEDYQILYLYGEKFGISKAKAFARQVLSDRDNVSLADKMRINMIKELEK